MSLDNIIEDVNPVTMQPVVQPRYDNLPRAFCVCGHARKWHQHTRCDGKILVSQVNDPDIVEFIQCFCKHFEFKEMRET